MNTNYTNNTNSNYARQNAQMNAQRTARPAGMPQNPQMRPQPNTVQPRPQSATEAEKENKAEGGFKKLTAKLSKFADTAKEKFYATATWYAAIRPILLLLSVLATVGFAILMTTDGTKGDIVGIIGSVIYFIGIGAALLSGPWKYIKVALAILAVTLKVFAFVLLIPIIGWTLGLALAALFAGLVFMAGAFFLIALPCVPALYCFFNEGGFKTLTRE